MLRKTIFLLTLLTLSGCASKLPTSYYSLGLQTPPAGNLVLPEQHSIGILPVSLPSMLDRTGIVSQKEGAKVQVASHHVWAGDLQESLTRIIAQGLSTRLQTNKIFPGPWDAQFRPEFQLEIDIQELIGTLGGKTRLQVHWQLLGDYGKERLFNQISRLEIDMSGDSYEDYVSSMDDLMTLLVTEHLAPKIFHQVKNQ